MRHLPALLVGLVLLVPVVLAATTLINTISNATADESTPFRNFDGVANALADFDRDGIPEIVTHNDNKRMYVLSSTTSHVLAEILPPYPPTWGARPLSEPTIEDVDGDGLLDIILVTSAGTVCDFEYGPGWTFTKRWCTTMNRYSSPGADAGAAVADVDGDGKMESFSQVETLGLYAFNSDGSIRWSKQEYGGNAGPLVADLDNDGKKEVVFFSDGGKVRAYDASSGVAKWTFYANNYVLPASISVTGSTADLDGDGKKEIVFTARDAPATNTDFSKNHVMIFVLNHNGALKAHWQPLWANPLSYTHPVLIDVDGDGDRDILLQDWNTIGHKPGNWERLGDANVFAYTPTGSLLWRTSLHNSWSNDDLAVADVDGDGAQEVLVIGYNGGLDGIWYLDLRTGIKESHVALPSGLQVLRGPMAGNLDGSGKTGWAASISGGGAGGQWKVYRTSATCSVAYGGWQNEFGCDGKTGGGTTPPPGGGGTPPPPTGGAFVFTPSSSGNEWWAQVKVSPQPAQVQAMDTGGAWVPLSFKSWGQWAGTFHIEPGHQVKYRASNNGSTWTESCWYAHPAGTCSS